MISTSTWLLNLHQKKEEKYAVCAMPEEKFSAEDVDVFENLHVHRPVSTSCVDPLQTNGKFVRKAGATLLQTQNSK